MTTPERDPVSPLDDTLHAVAGELEHPPTPDLATAVQRRLLEHPRRRPLRTRRLVLAMALALLLPAGAIAAVPPVRDALRDVLGIGAVKIERSPRPLPPLAGGSLLAPASRLGLGRRIAPGAARVLRFAAVAPRLAQLGDPDEVYVRSYPPGGALSYVYRPNTAGSSSKAARRAAFTRRGLLITQLRGRHAEVLAGKLAGPATTFEPVVVCGERGVWIAGRPHGFAFVDVHGRTRVERLHLAGDTLLWARGALTLRLEGASSKAVALRIARSVR